MSKKTTEEEHKARLDEFDRVKDLRFSKDFPEEAKKFVDYQLEKIGKSQSKIPGRASRRDRRRKHEWERSLENIPEQCATLSRDECMVRRDCFLSGYNTDGRGRLETNLDLVNSEDGRFNDFSCKNIRKLEPVSALSNAEMSKKKK